MSSDVGMPSRAVLRWVSEAVGAAVVDVVSLRDEPGRDSGSFRLRMGSNAEWPDLALKVMVPGWIGKLMVATNAQALQIAESHGLAAPRLVASDLDGTVSGTVATLETWLPGRSTSPTTLSVTRLENAGEVIAKIHAVVPAERDDLEVRRHPVPADDFARDRREGRMPTTPLLQHADDLIRQHGEPDREVVFVHGDVWDGNMLWDGDVCTGVIDWKAAGIGSPGVDLGGLRHQMALQYGPDAPPHVLRGWQRRTGQDLPALSYWDAVAALNTPTVLEGFPGFAPDGSSLDAQAMTERRDDFLQTALDSLVR